MAYPLPSLQGNAGGAMFGEALRHLCSAHDNGDTVAELVTLFDGMALQIRRTTAGSWVANRFSCVDGSSAFVGKTNGKALAITAGRQILTGSAALGPGELVNLLPVPGTASGGRLLLLPAPDGLAANVRVWR
jgi:hypothetical protein